MNSANYNWVSSTHGFRYFKFSKSALLLEWPSDKSEKTLNKIKSVVHLLQEAQPIGIVDLIPAYHSMTIAFKSNLTSHATLIEFIEQSKFKQKKNSNKSAVITIPVHYGGQHGSDLSDVASELGMTEADVIQKHMDATYLVHFIGFLPGFLYLGGLDEKLSISRRETPRLRVPAGSVALAGGQTGIYPIESPGGWHIIGKTDIELFNPFSSPPCPFESGTRIKFESVLS